MLKDWRRVFTISLSAVTQPEGCFKYCPLWKRPYIPPVLPTKTNKRPAITNTECRKFKKGRGKRTARACVYSAGNTNSLQQVLPMHKTSHDAAVLWASPQHRQTHFHTACHLVCQTQSQRDRYIDALLILYRKLKQRQQIYIFQMSFCCFSLRTNWIDIR